VGFRLFDMSATAFCDFLGFNLDSFVDQCRDGGLVNSPLFNYPTDDQMGELMAHMNLKGYKLRFKSSDRKAFFVYPTNTHEAVASNLTWFFSNINHNRSFHSNLPMRVFGTGGQHMLTGRLNQPDLCTQVLNRTHQSANMVQETHYRSSQSMTLYHERLRNFILDTQNIMMAIGIKVYDFDEHGSFAAIIIVYERTADNQAQITHNVSFGSMAPTAHEIAEWEDETPGIPLTGIGITGYPVCSADTQNHPIYMLPLR